MRKIFERSYDDLVKRMPPRTAASLDLRRPAFRAPWGGPLNGQEFRRSIVRSWATAVSFDVVLETGTYRGSTTEFFRAVFGLPVETVEGNSRFYHYSRRRLAFDPQATVMLGDSRQFLRDMTVKWPTSTVFIYLDAHWEHDLPLAEELEIIKGQWDKAVVMIDDFAVPGDAGYKYDDYGAGRALTQDYLPDMPGWSLRYPAAPSSEETGAKRGSCYLVSPALANVEIKELRSA